MSDPHGDRVPGVGNSPATVCVECGEILVYDENLTPHVLDADDLDDIPADVLQELARIQKIARSLAETRARHRRGGWAGPL
jgi:hypothetical protein